MTYETAFGTVEAEVPFDACDALDDHVGCDCDDCFEARWPRPTDPMVELIDESDDVALAPFTTPTALAA